MATELIIRSIPLQLLDGKPRLRYAFSEIPLSYKRFIHSEDVTAMVVKPLYGYRTNL